MRDLRPRKPEAALVYLTGRDEPGVVGRVLGRVALWGLVVEGEHGWRAELAYPAALESDAAVRVRCPAAVVGRTWVALALLGLAIAVSGPGASAGGERAGKLTPPTVMHIDGGSVSLPASLDVSHAGDGLAADPGGNIYVGYERSDFSEHVAVLDSKGHFVRDWEVEHGVNFHLPKVAFGGPDGLVYVAPSADPETIKIYEPDGTFVRQFLAGAIETGSGDIEVDSSGNVYVSSADVTGRPDRFVVRFDPAGNVTKTWIPQPGGRGNVGGSIAVAPDGSIYEVGLPTVNGDSMLTHLAADGPVISSKDLDKALGSGEYHDVDYANGRLYLSGNYSTAAGASHHHALAVLAADGTVQDQLLGEGNRVAISDDHVWVTDLNTSPGSRRPAANGFSIGGFGEVPIENTSNVNKFAAYNEDCNKGGGAGSGGAEYGNLPVFIASSPSPDCVVQFYNERSPCTRPQTHGVPTSAYLGGRQAAASKWGDGAYIQFKGTEIQTGPVVLRWSCRDATGQEVETHYEWKGDTTGSVIRAARSSTARTGRPLVAATVRIEFSESAAGPLGPPPALTTLPQNDREVTGTDGRFRWDVADGYWRLQASAVGYHAATSRVYTTSRPRWRKFVEPPA